MPDPTPEERRATERLEMAGRLDVAEHLLARCREVIGELRTDPRANVWRTIGRLEVILGMLGDDEGKAGS